MTKKLVPTRSYAEKDARFLRQFFLSVINDESLAGTATGMKVRVEAGKNLAKLQHLLQVDKISSKISSEERQAQKELTDQEKATVDNILKNN